MSKFYYLIWVDCLVKARRDGRTPNWRLVSMLMMSIAMTFNLVLIISLLEKFIFGVHVFRIDMPFKSEYWNNVGSFVVLFFMPCVIVNYLLVFRNGRYTELIGRFPYHNGRWFLVYFLFSTFLPISLLWIGLALD